MTLDTTYDYSIKFIGAKVKNHTMYPIHPKINLLTKRHKTYYMDNFLNPNFLLSTIGIIVAQHSEKSNYILLHASGVIINGKAILFTGSSGSGKSTAMSKLLSKYLAVAEDQVILTRMNNKIVAYPCPINTKINLNNTPNIPYEVSGVCFIKKNTSLKINKVSKHISILKLIDQTLVRLNSMKSTKKAMEMLSPVGDITYELSCGIDDYIDDIITSIIT